MALVLTIPIDEIPAAGLELSGELPAEWFAESLLEPYEALSGLSVTLTLKRYNDNVHVEGHLRVRLGFSCSRTLAPGITDVDTRVSELFQKGEANQLKLGDGVETDDMEAEMPHVYVDNEIDLEPLVREELVLAQEPYPTIADRVSEGPAWSNGDVEPLDPRWEKLKSLKLN